MIAHTLVFLRHGQTDWNVEHRLQGQRDIPLNDTGRGQARRNGRALAALFAAEGWRESDFAWVTSPLGRARETMDIARSEAGLPAGGYTLDPRLKEITFGAWEGFTYDELEVHDADAVTRRLADKWGTVPPGGESYAMLFERIRAWAETVDRDMVVVSHGGVFRVLRGLIDDVDPSEIPDYDVPQDRFYLWRGGAGRWI